MREDEFQTPLLILKEREVGRLFHTVRMIVEPPGPEKPKRNWIQEERRKTLGDWVSFCLDCGAVQRYFLEHEAQLPARCPGCGGETRHRCPACRAPIPSAFAIECEECGAAVRPPEVMGVRIRRPGR